MWLVKQEAATVGTPENSASYLENDSWPFSSRVWYRKKYVFPLTLNILHVLPLINFINCLIMIECNNKQVLQMLLLDFLMVSGSGFSFMSGPA